MNSVYILYSKKLDSFYIGETENLAERIDQHNSGFYNKAYTKKANDWELFYTFTSESKSQALKIERHIKKMKSKIYIWNLKKYPEMTEKLKKLK
ncbi:MAG: GIY-YIG nuclease family protein [Leeuwenhoekiella sp.]